MIQCFLLIVAVYLTGCNESKAKPPLPPVNVSIQKIQAQTIPYEGEYIGVAESSHPVEIRSRVEGWLNEIDYIEGSYVKKGNVLFRIDPKPFQAALDQAKAELDRTKAVLWNATKTRERFEPLYAQHAASLRDLDNSIAEEMSAMANVQAAQAQVVQAELNLGYTVIETPVDGLSGPAKWRQGALIMPSGETGYLTTVSVVDPIWVNFYVPDRDILSLRTLAAEKVINLPNGLSFKVQLKLSDGSTFPYEGTVDFANPVLEQSTGTMLVRSVVKNPDRMIKPGQFLRGTIIGAIMPNAIVVPQGAVMQGKNGMFVYLVGEDNKVIMQNVEAGQWYQSSWVIKSGLKPGDVVIVDGVSKVQPGQVVNPQPMKPSQKPDDNKSQQG